MSTYTFSGTDTYSVSDVKAVMQNTYEDIVGFANRQILDYSRAKRWIDDLTYLLNKSILKAFELQLYDSAGVCFKSYRYDVNTWGLISSGSSSGGINYFEIKEDTAIRLLAVLDENHHSYTAVLNELNNNLGWGNDGSAMNGNTTFERNYTSGSLQLKRSVITK